jgi:hypothetical protein
LDDVDAAAQDRRQKGREVLAVRNAEIEMAI